MSDQSAIQWTDSTWNIVTGCTRVGPGCARCYIERTPPFRMQRRRFARVGNEETTGVTLHWDRLDRVPRGPKVFTPSLGDLFHEQVPFEFLHEAFKAMRRADDRIFQVLTKRPERALEYLGGWTPLPNVWVGVSIENARFTWRADVLREIPAAVRFISAEPLLGSLFQLGSARTTAKGGASTSSDPRVDAVNTGRAPLDLTGIDWLIIGGESGPGARPLDLAHVWEIIDECYVLGTRLAPKPAIFVKQLGSVWAKQHTARKLECGPADAKGGDLEHWPPRLRIREFPRAAVPA